MEHTRKQQVAEWLNERWMITLRTDMPDKIQLANETFYRGAFEAIEKMGFRVIRDETGHHLIIKN